MNRPSYTSLLAREKWPAGSSWGLYGADDQVGALNEVTPDHIVSAAELVTRGQVFALNWGLDRPDPPLFGRGRLHHEVHDFGFLLDDHYDNFYPQASSQWDALSHFRHPRWGYYNGRTTDDMLGEPFANGIQHWARRGIVGRYLLADVARWRAKNGRPIDCRAGDAVSVDELQATLDAQGSEPAGGDILLLRFGWVGWYDSLEADERADLSAAKELARAPGLLPEARLYEWLWNSGFVGVGCDCPAVEAIPFDLGSEDKSLHGHAIALLGLALGEMFVLDPLAKACAVDEGYVGLLTSAPLNMPGGSGSPANALALR